MRCAFWIVLCFALGCGGSQTGVISDQDEMSRYLEQNPELRETNSEEPDTSNADGGQQPIKEAV